MAFPCKLTFQCLLSQEMAPRKLPTKRSRKDTTGEGSSVAPQADMDFDRLRFWSAEHQQRFETIKGWSFLRERRVQLRDDEFPEFQGEIARRHWAPLVRSVAKFDLEILIEFYANAWPTEEGVRE